MTVTELKEALIELESEGHGALHVGIKHVGINHDSDYEILDTVIDGIKLDPAKHGAYDPLKDCIQFVRLEF